MSSARQLPWQQAQWQQLQTLLATGRLPHALLLAGPEGVGKRHFADLWSRRLLCRQPEDGGACERCRTCQLAAAGSHPDWLSLGPENKSHQIRIDAVRELVRFTSQTASQGSVKVVLLTKAEAMNRHAVNALLKCLEEPPPGTYLLLISDQPEMLPATLRSRCQRLAFPVPSESEVKAWLTSFTTDQDVLQQVLEEAGGRPLRARALLDPELLAQRRRWREQLLALLEGRQHAISVAADWNEVALEEVLGWLELRLAAAVRLALTAPETAPDALTLALAQRGAPALLRWRDRILERRAQLARGVNFSRPLVLEELLL